MLIDGRTLHQEKLAADICIVGGGPAGIALALEFADTNVSVILLEGGGVEFEEPTQQLYAGSSSKIPLDVQYSRLRFLGGASNHWEGMCAPLDAADFEAREWVNRSGWPFRADTLNTYYKRAASFLNMSGNANTDFSAANLLAENRWFSYGAWRQAQALRTGQAYLGRLKQSNNIRLILHSNVTHIHSADSRKQVSRLDVATLAGQRFSVEAGQYVLACGGIENARLLLASGGLGNQHDLVGRFFMEHARYAMGTLYSFGKPTALMPFEQHMEMQNPPDKIHCITPSPATMKTHRLLNGCAVIRDIEKTKATPDIAAYMGTFFKNTAHVWQMTLFGRTEQAPMPDNRVRLTEERDALGMPRVDVSVALGEQEWSSAHQFARLLGQYVSAQRLGVLRLRPWLREYKGWPEYVLWSGHHMGTTRMHDDPRQGVVDADCRVHGMDNLHIAGSSVFPTSGWANPTYTLVALSLRLADRLKARLSGS